MSRPQTAVRRAVRARFLASVAAVAVATGCAAPRVVTYEAYRYKIDVDLDPVTHAIRGQASLDLVRASPDSIEGDGPVAVELLLHPDLKISAVHATGADARMFVLGETLPRSNSAQTEGADVPRSHFVRLKEAVESLTLTADFEGALHQDVSAGEKPGEIHNLKMSAHIGSEGIYLAEGHWYPQPASAPQAVVPLAYYTLSAGPITGITLVASGDTDETLEHQTGRRVWHSPHAISKLVLVGGGHEVHRAHHGGIDLAVHVSPQNAGQAGPLLEAVKKNLDRYMPLLGPYPARQYTIVENFFSSGFAFPCFTLLSSEVIRMGERGWGRHGYLDHEFLHSWWGAGVHVDPRDGNWCESLASYGANYYGYVLDGDEQGARKKRRNICHYLSRMKTEDDKPLGTFDLPGGCNRTIAYDKGAMVFHMLAQTIGQEHFWEGIRRFNEGHLGKNASWDDLQRVFEQEGGIDLDWFFQQWVRSKGVPLIEITGADLDSDGMRLDIAQEPAFRIDHLVVDLLASAQTDTHGARLMKVPVSVEGRSQIVHVPDVSASVTHLELDPDYLTLRRVEPEQLVPTTALTRSGKGLTVVLPEGEVSQKLKSASVVFRSSFKADQALEKTIPQIKPKDELAERNVLILGEAARDSMIDAFLAAIEFPLHWSDEGFSYEDEEFTQPGHAVLCTISHPGVPGGGVTVVYGNSEAALPRAELIPFYENSLVIFEEGVPILRDDFERKKLVSVRPITSP